MCVRHINCRWMDKVQGRHVATMRMKLINVTCMQSDYNTHTQTHKYTKNIIHATLAEFNLHIFASLPHMLHSKPTHILVVRAVCLFGDGDGMVLLPLGRIPQKPSKDTRLWPSSQLALFKRRSACDRRSCVVFAVVVAAYTQSSTATDSRNIFSTISTAEATRSGRVRILQSSQAPRHTRIRVWLASRRFWVDQLVCKQHLSVRVCALYIYMWCVSLLAVWLAIEYTGVSMFLSGGAAALFRRADHFWQFREWERYKHTTSEDDEDDVYTTHRKTRTVRRCSREQHARHIYKYRAA